MPALRRPAASRPLAASAVLSGAGAALVGAVAGVLAVAVCWLPASGSAGNANSAIRAGVLTFLAALHAGITVDGVATSFVPIGMTVLVAVIAWRAGCALAATTEDAGEYDVGRLTRLLALQAASFGLACGALAELAPLGTSHVAVLPAFLAGTVLFVCSGGLSMARSSALGDELAARIPGWVGPSLRVAAGMLVTYLSAGALLVAGALVVHHDRVEAITGRIGGWSGLPVLVVGLLAVPNAAVAGSSYLSGAGFDLGTHVSVTTGAHGAIPAFPVLGGLPDGRADVAAWVLAVLTPVAAGACSAVLAARADTWSRRWSDALAGTLLAGLGAGVLAWLGGGALGPGRLSGVGATVWQYAGAVAVGSGAVCVLALAVVRGVGTLRDQSYDVEVDDERPAVTLRSVLTTIKDTGKPEEGEGHDQLAG